MTDHLLRCYPVILEVPVRWGDMDAFQHVNNIVYFQYFESARVAYLEALGVVEFMNGTTIGPILASIDCRFRFPVTYPDTLRVGARVSQLGSDRFVIAHRAVSTQHGRLAAEGEGMAVTFDYAAQRKAPLPEMVRARILALEASLGNVPELLSDR
jgi:acyl-CoA thioester hydrolase